MELTVPVNHVTIADRPIAVGRILYRTLLDAGISFCGRRVLAMCSGGADSVALVDLLACLPAGGKPAALHVLFVDHGLRGVEHDLRCVRAICGLHRLELHRAACELALDEAPGGTQAAARRWRYDEARRHAVALGCDTVATGHSADDQLETVLYALAAGGGLRALGGMPWQRASGGDGGAAGLHAAGAEAPSLVRPLLGLSRAQLRAHVRERGLQWVDDPSNRDTAYRRNLLRAQAVPALLAAHPGAGRNIERTRRQLAETQSATEALAAAFIEHRQQEGGGLPVASLRELAAPARRAVLATWLRAEGAGRSLTERGIRAVDRLALGTDSQGAVQLGRACVRRDGYVLRMWRAPSAQVPTRMNPQSRKQAP